MDSNQENEVRQQRLSLTWHGTNEGGSYKELAGESELPQDPKPETAGLKILKRPATIQTAEQHVEPADIKPVQAEEVPEVPEVQTELKMPEAPEERTTVVAKTPAIADVPAVAEAADDGAATAEQVLEQVSATATLSVDGVAQDGPAVKEEITCSQLLRSGVTVVSEMNYDGLDQDEGATATLPAIAPAEVNEEFTTEREIMPEETEAPRKVVLSRMPDDQGVDRPKPALTLDRDENDVTSRLKVRKAPAIKTTNTCKMKPDTQELVAGGTLGEKLRNARAACQMDLFEVAEKTRISSEYISALEEERFDGLPLAAIYIKSYLKTLARCYGIDSDELIAEYEERTGLSRHAEQQARARKTTDSAEEKADDVRGGRWISWAIGAVAAIVVVVLVAGVLLNNRLGGLSKDEAALVNDTDLREIIPQEFLPYRQRPIPLRETAAVGH